MSMFSITSCSVTPRRRRGGLERIEVHAHEIDELDLVLGGRGHVLLVVAQREQPGVELRVQRLDAAAHDLREAREVLDRADLEPRLAQRGRRCRRSRPARRRAPARPRANSTIPVLSETESSARRTRTSPGCTMASIGPRKIPGAAVRRPRPGLGAGGMDRAGPRRGRSARPRAVSRSCSSGRSASRTAAGSTTSGSSTARWRMTGPESIPSSTKWTVTPNTFTP